MGTIAELNEAIDLALDLSEWHRRYVVARVFLRAMPCIFTQSAKARSAVSPSHVLGVYRAGLLLCVAAQHGPLLARIGSLEKHRLPDEGAQFDIAISAMNAARSAVVGFEHSERRCSELCMADAMDAMAKFEREREWAGLSNLACAMLQKEIETTSDPDALDFSEPLWPALTEFPSMDRSFSGAGVPRVFLGAVVSSDFLSTPFWHEWYWGVIRGKPLDWNLQRRVALIDDTIWEAGPEAVAHEIERIRREMAGPAPLEREKLLTHVKHLLANPVVTESAALSAAETVERAIRTYKEEAPANCLPDGLEHLEGLPGHFRAIAKVVANPAVTKDMEEELRREIESLHAKVVKLERDLVEARSKTLKGVISAKAAEKLGTTLGNPVFYGGIAMGVGYFFGVTPSDMTFENLRGFIQELTSANAEAPVAPAQILPHVHDI